MCSSQNNNKMLLLMALVIMLFFSPAHALDIDTEPVQPVPTDLDLDQRKVALGKRLFHDPSLSSNNKISCASCHSLNKGGVDRLKNSLGVSGKPGCIWKTGRSEYANRV